MTTDYSEASPEELLNIGLAQLAEAQDAYNAMLVGNAWSPATLEGPPRDTLRGEGAKAHSTWLLESAHGHFRAALALDMVTTASDLDDLYDDTDEPDEASDGPPQ